MKARLKNRLIFSFQIVFAACLIFLNPSCGLDEYHVLYGPSVVHYPVYSSNNIIEYPNRYFEFTTRKDDKSSGDFIVDGTDVYYKIYSNLSTCASEYSALNTLANNTSSSASSVNSMINSYKFQKMKIYGAYSDAFVTHDGEQKNIRIRLTTYLEVPTSEAFMASVRIDGTNRGSPVRYYGDRFFDFYRYRNSSSNAAPIPRTTSYEDDVSSNSSVTSEGFWYITLYAVTTGHDGSFTSYYSPIVHLGTLAIDATSYEN